MIRIKPLKAKCDKLFSQFIRSLGECERCHRSVRVQLQTAHIFSRRYVSTRYEPLNALCLCAGCHRWGHDNPVEFVEFIKELLGETVYEDLRDMAKNKVVKSNDMFYQEIIRKLKNNESPYVV
jgi:hypothetical protein